MFYKRHCQCQLESRGFASKPLCKPIEKNPLNRQPTSKDSDINNGMLNDGDYNCTIDSNYKRVGAVSVGAETLLWISWTHMNE